MSGTPRTSRCVAYTPRRRSCDRSEESSAPREIPSVPPDPMATADPRRSSGSSRRACLAPPPPEERSLPIVPALDPLRYLRPAAPSRRPSRLGPSRSSPVPSGALRPHRSMALREGEEPGQRGATNLTIAEDPRSPSGSVGRRVFLSVPSSLRCGRKTAAAAFGVHTETSAVFPSSTSNSRGKGGAREHPENSSPHVRRPVANHWT